MVVTFVEISDRESAIDWKIDAEFMTSGWACKWADGCVGILDEPAAELGQGCCSLGAELLDADEAMRISALGAALDPARFQFAEAVTEGGVFSDQNRDHTRVVDGACVFLNRPGFEGGAGCALHLGALDDDEDPIDWKPSICWQLPIKIDWDDQPDGSRSATLRRWRRSDWGPGGATMAWCCTEAPGIDDDPEHRWSAYSADTPVWVRHQSELLALLGPQTYDQMAAALGTAPEEADESRA